MRPAAVASVVDWAMTAMPAAYCTDTEHNVYFTADDLDLPADDPRRTRVRSAKGGLAYDQIPSGSPLRVAYESDDLTAFVGAALGSEILYRHADELGALNVMYYAEAGGHGWHFDGADAVVTLMLQPPLGGGQFEYVPMLRSADNQNLEGVRRLLQGDRSGVRSMSGAAGTLALFRGHHSPHRVTTVIGPGPASSRCSPTRPPRCAAQRPRQAAFPWPDSLIVSGRIRQTISLTFSALTTTVKPLGPRAGAGTLRPYPSTYSMGKTRKP